MFKLTIIAVALAVVSASLDAQWEVFKSTHSKIYTAKEEAYRRFVWQTNLKKIKEHNMRYAQGEVSFYLGENEYADLTNSEFRHMMNGFRANGTLNPGTFESEGIADALPKEVDWRKKGYVTPIKNQGQCGSCWAFSAVGSLEGQHFKSTGKLVSLSESNLVDCSQKQGNEGCMGGLMDNAFQYVIDNKGIDTEESYPYKAEDRKCKFHKADVGATEKSYKDIKSGSEEALQKAVAEIGPIAVAIDASQDSFQLYSGGVYDEPACSSKNLDHGVLAVGYGVKGEKDYWLVKNSWGASWGEKGYIMMTRNKKNQCGIATQASYPIV